MYFYFVVLSKYLFNNSNPVIITPPNINVRILNVENVIAGCGISNVVAPITIEYNEPNIIPNIVYTVCERNFSRHILINFVNVTIPAIIPNPNIINTGIAEKSSDIKAFTFSIIGMYKPNINNNVDPDIPGNIIADIAIIAAINI